MRVSPSGVSVLLTVSLYLSFLPTLLGFWNQNFRLRLSAWLMSSKVMPLAVSVFSFILVTVDFTFGRLLGDLTSWMQRVRPSQSRNFHTSPNRPVSNVSINLDV